MNRDDSDCSECFSVERRGLLALAALTPPEWEITIFDEKIRVPDYAALPRPDLVGVTAFTSQANRAYEIVTGFRSRNVPVVMRGIHATHAPERGQRARGCGGDGRGQACLGSGSDGRRVTINMADDDKLLTLAAKAGCTGVFIGFESPTAEGLREVGKKFNLLRGRGLASSVRRIQRHKILVAGSFIMGLDADEPGIGQRIAAAGRRYAVDVLNTLFLTPLPGTRLWNELESNDRITADTFPEDWKYYTLTFPVACYKNFSRADIVREMETCHGTFYSVGNILRRVWSGLWRGRKPLIALVANLSYRRNLSFGRQACREFLSSRAQVEPVWRLARAPKLSQSERDRQRISRVPASA